MQGKTHILVGMAAGLALSQPVTAPFGIILGGIGGLLPDIDHPNGTLSNRLPLLRLLIFWIPHRTFTHSLWAALAMLLPALLIHPVLICLWAGYTLHIAADMATVRGIPLLYPLTRLNCYLLPRPLRLTTGGIMEMIFRVGVIVLFGALLLEISPFWLSMLQNPQLLDLLWF